MCELNSKLSDICLEQSRSKKDMVKISNHVTVSTEVVFLLFLFYLNCKNNMHGQIFVLLWLWCYCDSAAHRRTSAFLKREGVSNDILFISIPFCEGVNLLIVFYRRTCIILMNKYKLTNPTNCKYAISYKLVSYNAVKVVTVKNWML